MSDLTTSGNLLIECIYDFVRSHNVKINNPIEFNIEKYKKIDNSYIKVKLPDISHTDYYYIYNIEQYILKTTKIKLYVNSHILDEVVILNHDRYIHNIFDTNEQNYYHNVLEKNNKETLLFMKLLLDNNFSYLCTNIEVSFGSFWFVIQLELEDICNIIINEEGLCKNEELINYIKNNIEIELINHQD